MKSQGIFVAALGGLVVGIGLIGCAVSSTRGAAAAGGDVATGLTYCNPIPLPDYPVGKRARDIVPGAPIGSASLWLSDRLEQFRELADVTVLWVDKKWYMYPSVDMAWVSSDGVTWEHHPMNIRDVGYAPTVVQHKGKFLLITADSPLYTADSPLGPFTQLGRIRLPAGVAGQGDPALFSDEDGRLYYYWGCTAADGIYGVELDADNPTRLIGTPVKIISFEPEKYPWQKVGDWNEDPSAGWIEGSWMLKRNGTYYLTYSSAGTENRTYCVACVRGKSPLGPFEAQKNNPILRSTTGLITGTAHGSFVEGPNDSLWAFYTVRAAVVHGFERRLGMDPAYIDGDGELCVAPPSSMPQRMLGNARGAEPTGWLPLNTNRRTIGSTTAPNLSGRLAVDDDMRTWWQPAADDKAPVLTTSLPSNSTVQAVRIIWRDFGLNTSAGAVPGPYRYKVEVQTGGNTWATIIDRSASTEDMLIDYRTCTPTRGNAARLVITGVPAGLTPEVAEFTVFGNVSRRGG